MLSMMRLWRRETPTIAKTRPATYSCLFGLESPSSRYSSTERSRCTRAGSANCQSPVSTSAASPSQAVMYPAIADAATVYGEAR
jgi:hypothetical protein